MLPTKKTENETKKNQTTKRFSSVSHQPLLRQQIQPMIQPAEKKNWMMEMEKREEEEPKGKSMK